MLDFLSPATYSLAFKISYLTLIIPTVLVIVTAVLSSKEMGGSLGNGLKRVAAGSIIHTILITTYIFLERGQRGILNDQQVKVFFAASGIFASTLLILGYIKLYRLAKKLKLFIP